MVVHLPFENAPGIGHTIKQVGRTVDILSHPCQVDGVILVKAAFAALPALIWGYIKPDRMAVSFSRRKGPHRSGFRFNPFLGIEITEGQIIERFGAIGLALFRVGEFAQRVGNWMLVADLAASFAYNWVSTAYKWSGCLPTDDKWCQLGPGTVPHIAVGPDDLQGWELRAGDPVFDGILSIIIPENTEYTVSIALSAEPFAPLPELFSVPASRIYDKHTGYIYQDGAMKQDGGSGAYMSGHSFTPPRVNRQREIVVAYTLPPGRVADVTGSQAWVSARYDPGPDP